MNSLESLEEVLVEELKDLYSAETQIVKALPKVIKAVSLPSLRTGISNHLEETKRQVERLEQIGALLGEKLTGETCEAAKGLIEETNGIIKDYDGEPQLIDLMLIGACQRIEHYEIAGYGVARTLAKALSLSEIARMLQETLEEEKAADEKLSKIAEDEILSEYAGSSDKEEDEDDDEDSRGNKRTSNKNSASSREQSLHASPRSRK